MIRFSIAKNANSTVVFSVSRKKHAIIWIKSTFYARNVKLSIPKQNTIVENVARIYVKIAMSSSTEEAKKYTTLEHRLLVLMNYWTAKLKYKPSYLEISLKFSKRNIRNRYSTTSSQRTTTISSFYWSTGRKWTWTFHWMKKWKNWNSNSI